MRANLSMDAANQGPFAWPSGRAETEAVAIAGAVSRTIVKLGCDGRHVSVRALLIQQRARLTRRKNRWCKQCKGCEASLSRPFDYAWMFCPASEIIAHAGKK